MADTPAFVQNLIDALTKNLGDAGLECEIKIEPVAGTKMYRFFVISDGFAAMQHSERQTVVWRIVDKAVPQSDAVKAGGVALLSAEAFFKAAHTVLPPGALPPDTRRMKNEIDKRVRALKDRPYQAEVFRVDVVRWASGIMGEITAGGLIRRASSEGQCVDFQLPLAAAKDWLTPDRRQELASQPCEFVLHRTREGRDADKDGVYLLADLYLTDLAENWEEWLQRHSLTLASRTIAADLATVPVTLETVGVEAEWLGLRAPALARVKIRDAKLGGREETVRLRSAEVRLKKFPEFARKLNKAYRGKTVHLTLLVSPDGRPYVEFGQKRVARILFRDQQKTLLMLMREARAAE